MTSEKTTEHITILGIYFGIRGNEFKNLIIKLLNKSKLRKKIIDVLTTPTNMEKYSAAFTSDLVDEERNYQVYEQLGDLIGNQFIVWYIYRRFPQLRCSDGVKVAARLRINYGAKNSFYKFAEKLGFWPFITATKDIRYRKKKDLLEDVFEAFIGVTALILDEEMRIGVGNAIVYQILECIFDEIDISLRYEDLYDAKTRLKELFDIYEDTVGPLKYEIYRDEEGDNLAHAKVYRVMGGSFFQKSNGKLDKKRIVGGTPILIGKGKASLESDAEQAAAAEGLEQMKRDGYYKIPPKCYQRFMNPDEIPCVTITPKYLLSKYGENINELVKTKNKSKYQCRYESTVLSMYCRQRNINGVKTVISMGADISIRDTDGMTALDLLFIGKIDPPIVKTIMKIIVKTGQELTMNVGVMDTYYDKYDDKYFHEKAGDITPTEFE